MAEINEIVNRLRDLASKAIRVEDLDLTRYTHGGGRLAVTKPGKPRELVADFYSEHDRELFMALRLSVDIIVEELARVERLERAVKDLCLLNRKAHKFLSKEAVGRRAVQISQSAGVVHDITREASLQRGEDQP
jgi:hypothetical protein